MKDINWSILKFLSAQIGYAVRKAKRLQTLNRTWRLRNIIAISDFLLASLGALLRNEMDIEDLPEHVHVPILVPVVIADQVMDQLPAAFRRYHTCAAKTGVVWPALPSSGIECSDLENEFFEKFIVLNSFICERTQSDGAALIIRGGPDCLLIILIPFMAAGIVI